MAGINFTVIFLGTAFQVKLFSVTDSDKGTPRYNTLFQKICIKHYEFPNSYLLGNKIIKWGSLT